MNTAKGAPRLLGFRGRLPNGRSSMSKVVVIEKPDGSLGAIPVRDEDKAKELVAKTRDKLLNVAGTKCKVKGLMSEEEYEDLKLFWHLPAKDKWLANGAYFKKYKKWPTL